MFKPGKTTVREYLVYQNLLKDTHTNKINQFLKTLRTEYPGDYLDYLNGSYPDFVPEWPLDELQSQLIEINRADTLAKVHATLSTIYDVEDLPSRLSDVPKPLMRHILLRWVPKSNSKSTKWNINSNGLIDLDEIRVFGAIQSNLSEFTSNTEFLDSEISSILNYYAEIKNQQQQQNKINAIPSSIVANTLALVNGNKHSKPDDFNPWIDQSSSKEELDSIACSILNSLVKDENLNSWVAQAIDLGLLKQSACELPRSPNRVLRSKDLILVKHYNGISPLVIKNPRSRINTKKPIYLFSLSGELEGKYKLDFEGLDNDYVSFESVKYERLQ